jgi:hypothetical protein
VLKALRTGVLPVIPSIEALSVLSQKPNWQELKEVLNMQHLVQCLESMFLHSQELVYNLAGFRMPDTICRNRPVHIKEHLWQERFYGGMYRILLAGATVAGGYLEPYLDAENSLDNDMLQHNAGKKVIEFFRKFAVYNFDVLDDSEIGKWRYEEYEKMFGPFARWIVEDGRAAKVAVVVEDKRDGWARNSGEKGSVQQLMSTLVAYEHRSCSQDSGRLLLSGIGTVWIRSLPRQISYRLSGRRRLGWPSSVRCWTWTGES